MAQPDMGHKEEYKILLDLLAKVINANRDYPVSSISDGERLLEAHYLANKFIGHALTVLYISHSTSVKDLPSFKQFNFIDSASIDVLTRASFEAFLVFHYVFYAPSTAEEKDYRYWSYKAAGLSERQNLPEFTKEYEQKKAEEKIKLDELRRSLESNGIFRSLTARQQNQVFEGKGKWKWKPNGLGQLSWREIAIDAGFSEMLASHMYRHLSGYAHSSSMSALQTAQALLNREVERLVKPSINTMNVLVANMIREYCDLFPKVQDVLRESGASGFVDTWICIGRRLDENLDTGQDSD